MASSRRASAPIESTLEATSFEAATPPTPGLPGLYDLACAIHIHSTFSDGTASVEELCASARATGRDAVLLTDHDTLAARRAGFEGGTVRSYWASESRSPRGAGTTSPLASIASSHASASTSRRSRS